MYSPRVLDTLSLISANRLVVMTSAASTWEVSAVEGAVHELDLALMRRVRSSTICHARCCEIEESVVAHYENSVRVFGQ